QHAREQTYVAKKTRARLDPVSSRFLARELAIQQLERRNDLCEINRHRSFVSASWLPPQFLNHLQRTHVLLNALLPRVIKACEQTPEPRPNAPRETIWISHGSNFRFGERSGPVASALVLRHDA